MKKFLFSLFLLLPIAVSAASLSCGTCVQNKDCTCTVSGCNNGFLLSLYSSPSGLDLVWEDSTISNSITIPASALSAAGTQYTKAVCLPSEGEQTTAETGFTQTVVKKSSTTITTVPAESSESGAAHPGGVSRSGGRGYTTGGGAPSKEGAAPTQPTKTTPSGQQASPKELPAEMSLTKKSTSLYWGIFIIALVVIATAVFYFRKLKYQEPLG